MLSWSALHLHLFIWKKSWSILFWNDSYLLFLFIVSAEWPAIESVFFQLCFPLTLTENWVPCVFKQTVGWFSDILFPSGWNEFTVFTSSISVCLCGAGQPSATCRSRKFPATRENDQPPCHDEPLFHACARQTFSHTKLNSEVTKLEEL